MKLNSIVKGIIKFTQTNAPAIMAGTAAVGLVLTAVAAYKAGMKADKIVKEHKEKMNKVENGNKEAETKVYKETALKLAPVVIPPIVLGGLSIAMIFGSHSASKRRIAAISAAYSLSESSLKDLEKQMRKVLGDKKTQNIKDEITKEKLQTSGPVNEKEVIITGNGDVLCKDMYSGRYFRSNANKIGQAINWASTEVRHAMYVSLNEFYEQLGLSGIPLGNDVGWNVDDLNGGTLPITYTAILTEDEQPCLCVETSINVRHEFY